MHVQYTITVILSLLVNIFSPVKVIIQEPPIEEQPWYFGDIPRGDCVALLKRDGDYLVRFSSTTNGYVVTFWWKRKALHGHIERIKSKVQQEYPKNYNYICGKFYTASTYIHTYIQVQVSVFLRLSGCTYM